MEEQAGIRPSRQCRQIVTSPAALTQTTLYRRVAIATDVNGCLRVGTISTCHHYSSVSCSCRFDWFGSGDGFRNITGDQFSIPRYRKWCDHLCMGIIGRRHHRMDDHCGRNRIKLCPCRCSEPEYLVPEDNNFHPKFEWSVRLHLHPQLRLRLRSGLMHKGQARRAGMNAGQVQ